MVAKGYSVVPKIWLDCVVGMGSSVPAVPVVGSVEIGVPFAVEVSSVASGLGTGSNCTKSQYATHNGRTLRRWWCWVVVLGLDQTVPLPPPLWLVRIRLSACREVRVRRAVPIMPVRPEELRDPVITLCMFVVLSMVWTAPLVTRLALGEVGPRSIPLLLNLEQILRGTALPVTEIG